MIEREVAELRARVARLERALDHVCKQLGVQVPAEPLPGDVSERVLGLVRRGDKISAIKAHIEETGVDLAAAKKRIDELG